VAVDALSWINLGANLGAVGGVLWLLASGRLVARSWADAVVQQANHNATDARTAAEAADRRADLLQAAIVEQTAALRAVEALVRSQATGATPGGQPLTNGATS
jgi:hypothetical protein